MEGRGSPLLLTRRHPLSWPEPALSGSSPVNCGLGGVRGPAFCHDACFHPSLCRQCLAGSTSGPGPSAGSVGPEWELPCPGVCWEHPLWEHLWPHSCPSASCRRRSFSWRPSGSARPSSVLLMLLWSHSLQDHRRHQGNSSDRLMFRKDGVQRWQAGRWRSGGLFSACQVCAFHQPRGSTGRAQALCLPAALPASHCPGGRGHATPSV